MWNATLWKPSLFLHVNEPIALWVRLSWGMVWESIDQCVNLQRGLLSCYMMWEAEEIVWRTSNDGHSSGYLHLHFTIDDSNYTVWIYYSCGLFFHAYGICSLCCLKTLFNDYLHFLIAICTSILHGYFAHWTFQVFLQTCLCYSLLHKLFRFICCINLSRMQYLSEFSASVWYLC